ncbi:hypothetical protein ADUPG1_007455, partial [Aduncisulcus paluster]
MELIRACGLRTHCIYPLSEPTLSFSFGWEACDVNKDNSTDRFFRDVDNNGFDGYGGLGFDSGESALKTADTSKEGSRRENYPIDNCR